MCISHAWNFAQWKCFLCYSDQAEARRQKNKAAKQRRAERIEQKRKELFEQISKEEEPAK